MPPTYQGFSVPQSAASGNITLVDVPVAPFEWESGDLLLAVVATRDSVSCSMDSAWTLEAGYADGNTTGAVSRWVWSHRYDGVTMPSRVVSHSGGDAIIGLIVAYRDATAIRGIATANDTYDDASNTMTADAPPNAVTDNVVVLLAMVAETSISFGFAALDPTGWGETWNARYEGGALVGDYVALSVHDATLTGTPSGVVTLYHIGVDADHAYVSLALGPAVDATGTGALVAEPATLQGGGVLGAFGVESYPIPIIGLRPIRRLRQSPYVSGERVRVAHHRFALDLERGASRDPEARVPQVMLRWSDTNGKAWSAEHWVACQTIGEYRARAVWRRLGAARSRLYQVVISDPVKVALLDAFLDVEGGAS
jgi:hypothetical protein